MILRKFSFMTLIEGTLRIIKLYDWSNYDDSISESSNVVLYKPSPIASAIHFLGRILQTSNNDNVKIFQKEITDGIYNVIHVYLFLGLECCISRNSKSCCRLLRQFAFHMRIRMLALVRR